jgi:hypothetical protein
MDKKKITRRVAIGTVIGGLVAAPFVIRRFRNRVNDIEISNLNDNLVSRYFEESLDPPPLLEIQRFESPFTAVISHIPLLAENRKYQNFTFQIQAAQELMIAAGNDIVGKPENSVSTQNLVRKLSIISPNNVNPEPPIVLSIQTIPEGTVITEAMKKKMTVTCKLSINGRSEIEQTDMIPGSEVTAKYPDSPVSIGSKWTQRIFLPKGYNDTEGADLKHFEVQKSFIVGDERFFRFKTEVCYKIPKSAIPNLKDSKKDTESLLIRSVSLSDFNLELGFGVRESSITAIYEEVTNGNAKLIVEKTSAVLESFT